MKYQRAISILLVIGALCVSTVVFFKAVAPISPNTALGNGPVVLKEKDYEVERSREHPPKLKTEYQHDDCAPIVIRFTLSTYDKHTLYLAFSFVQSWTKVRLDGNLIYSYYPQKRNHTYDRPTSQFHLIRIPDRRVGKEITIEIIPSIKAQADNYPIIYLGDRGTLINEILLKALPKAFLSLTLFIMAFELMVLSFIRDMEARRELKHQIRSYAMLIMDISLWGFLETNIRQFIFGGEEPSLKVLMLAYCLMPALAAHFLGTFETFRKRKAFVVLVFMCWAQFFLFCSLLLTEMNPYILQYMTWIVSVALLLYMIIVIRKQVKENNLSRDLEAVYASLIWLPIGVFGEMFRYILVDKTQNGAILIFCLAAFTIQYVYLSIRRVVEENKSLRVEVEKERVRSMMAQINPHYLYNALTAIQTVVMTDPRQGADLVCDFSRHLRGSIKSVSVETVPFDEEIKNVKAYLNIEKARLGDRIETEYDIQNTDFDIVPLSVQPIVENACIHGIHPKGAEGGTIRIESYREADHNVIRVYDDGVGFAVDEYETEDDPGKHTGLKNLIYRLKMVQNGEVIIDSNKDKGTVVTLRIPE